MASHIPGGPRRIKRYDEEVRLSRAKAFVLGLLFACAAGLHACDVYDASLLATNGPAPQDRRNGIGWWSKDDGRGCFTAGAPRPEDRPPPGNPGDVGTIMMAIESMRLGSLDEQNVIDRNAWKGIGLDLDGVCTSSDTCDKDPVQSCRPTGSAVPRDADYCRDNTFGRLEHTAALVPEISRKYGLSDDGFNCALCVGHYNFLVKVSGYNGEPNDDRVRVDLYPSPGLEAPLPWDCADPSWRTRPCFTPDRPFTVQEDALTTSRPGPDLPDSRYADDNAYVRDGYMVMKIPERTLFWFPGTKGIVVAYPLRIENGTVVGRIGRGADGLWRVTDGVIAGRARGDDMVRGFRLIGLCETNDANYPLLTEFVTSNLDILADGVVDPNRTCDAMSFGLVFTAIQATAGKLETVPPLVECVQPKAPPDAGGGG
jgi:hypothetical protein